MFKICFPDENHNTIYDIDLSKLREKGYKNILIDIDNTITHWKSERVGKDLRDWIEKLKNMGYSISLFSNGKIERTKKMADGLGVFAIPMTGKPGRRSFKRALQIIEGKPENTIMIGDQMLTDVLGGNRIGLYTILVDPIPSKEFIGTKFNRLIEWLLGRR